MERNKKKLKIRKELIENLKKAFGTCIVKGYLSGPLKVVF